MAKAWPADELAARVFWVVMLGIGGEIVAMVAIGIL